MEFKHVIFEKLLSDNNLKKTDFANYSKIPYNTVAGWKKRDSVPPYAMVILKDIIYRKKLDMEAEQSLRRRDKVSRVKYSLTPNEENQLKSVFWGTNYTIDYIAKEIQHNNQTIIKRVTTNLPLNKGIKIISKLAHA